MLFSYPGYADFVEPLTLSDTSQVNLGNVQMIQKARLLQEVVVKQTVSAIRIKGDTTEFTADSFHVAANANVEDLLKKLPGIQVDKNGQITAQGQTVKKVLVDGEEFFGDDPTLVTQNLRADMVDKVQVYDKKSDQAAFTGIDDGQKDKTINIKLKEDKKRGYFGKLSAGAGADGHHEEQLMFNKFRKKEKFAAYGIVSNTGKSGLSWKDQSDYGDNGNMNYDEDNGYFYINGGSDPLDSWNGSYNDQGTPLVQNGGLHYNNKWSDDKESVNANYKWSRLMVDGNSSNIATNILPNTVNYSNSRESFKNTMTRNKGNGTYEVQFDSSSSLKVFAEGGNYHKITSNTSNTETLNADSSLLNKSMRNTSNTNDNNFFNSNLIWRKKLRKKGRTLSLNLQQKYTEDKGHGFLFAENDYYIDPSSPTQNITDQLKEANSKNFQLNTKLTYTEPLSTSSSIIANYALVVNNSASTLLSYNKAGDGKYSALDSVYSNDYTFNTLTNRGGLAYSYVRKKIRFNIGTDAGVTSFNQKDEMGKGGDANRHFVNWYPQMHFNYNFSNQRRLALDYNGSTRQPSIQQIQPVKTNNDPLNIVLGNPTLKPSFNSNINLFFFDYKVITEREFFISSSYNFTNNAIASSVYTDSVGRRTTQSVNVNGNRNFNTWLDYGFKWKKAGLYISFNGNMNLNRYVTIVNNENNITNSGNYTGGIRLTKRKEKWYDIGIEASATYNNSKSSIQKDVKTDYWTYQIQPSADVYLPLKFQVHSEINYNIRQQTAMFSGNNNVFLWNAWIGKKLLKKDALLIKLSGNDLLNQNIGLRRNISSNYISENRYATIRRFFLLSVVWNFSNNGATAAPNK